VILNGYDMLFKLYQKSYLYMTQVQISSSCSHWSHLARCPSPRSRNVSMRFERKLCVTLRDSPDELQELVGLVLVQGGFVCEFSELKVFTTSKRVPRITVNNGRPCLRSATINGKSLDSCRATAVRVIFCLECVETG
jgi:hypothetical protein